MKARIEIPPKLIPVFAPSVKRYRGAYGGRGSGKTYNFAMMLAVRGYMYAEQGISGMLLCGREIMESLDESSMEEVKTAIRSIDWLNDYYEIGEKFIRTKNRMIHFGFAGLRYNLDSIKSKARILIAWVDEAESVSDIAWKKLMPTVREHNSEVWITWNPEDEWKDGSGSATDKRFRKDDLGDDAIIVEMQHYDNPWFSNVLEGERQRDLKNLPYEEYLWIWEGHYRQISEAQIFRGKYRIDNFEIDDSFGDPLHGLDFGFANDPTATVRLYIRGNTLYVSHEAGKVGLELDDTADYIKVRIPDIEKYAIRADNARPESISYLKRHGLPRITGVSKGKGSVEDGIDFIRSFDEVVIHESCKEVASEFKRYSYKTEKRTGDILPVPVDAYNHYIDAIRYALEPIMKNKGQSAFTVRRR